MIFLRLLHLLAHHPDFSVSEEGLPDMAKYVAFLCTTYCCLTVASRYIEFYLDLVCTSENLSLLFHLSQKPKTVRDAEGHTYSEVRLLALSQSLSAERLVVRVESVRYQRTRAGSPPETCKGTQLGYRDIPWQGPASWRYLQAAP